MTYQRTFRALSGCIALGLCGCGGAVDKAASQQIAQADDPYFQAGADTLALRRAQTSDATANDAPAKNIIIFVGDGMGISTVTAARIHAGQMQGLDGESFQLSLDTFPHVALSRTYSHDYQISDSAATATAMMSGVKTRSGVLGVQSMAERGDCAGALEYATTSLFDLAERAGMSTGVISTARLTHATPAATYAHSGSRDWETDRSLPTTAAEQGCVDIASQLVGWPNGDGLELALGGGRANFLPNEHNDLEYDGATGWRGDGRDLTAEWTAKSDAHVYVWNAEQFDALDFSSDIRVLGLFDPSHMQYEADRETLDGAGEPSVAQMTAAAITRLSQDEDGYVLVVEAGRVDHAHHGGNAARALKDAVALDQAVGVALEMTDRADTLVMVTADHSHTLTISGYAARNNPILGLARTPDGELMTAFDGKPYTTLGYANGPGSVFVGDADLSDGRSAPPSEDEVLSLDYKQQSLVPSRSETHAGEDVAIYAWGPFDALFSGTVEQNYAFHALVEASNLMARSGLVEADKPAGDEVPPQTAQE